MEPSFWHARWKNSEIGFHQDEINPSLQEFWPQVPLKSGSQVFVPLCGKSRDLLWLREQGCRVLGVELSSIAAEAFFAENNLAVTISRSGVFTSFVGEDIVILCGDFFALAQQNLANVSAVYDRAALVAMPKSLRQRYVGHLRDILTDTAPTLLVTLDYPDAEMDGPPFAVTDAEVRTLYGPPTGVTELRCETILEQNPQFQSRGLSRLEERVYLIV